MPVPLRDITDVSRIEDFRSETAVCPKHRNADLTFDDVLPFISIGVPVQLPKCAGFKFENNASDRCRNWKARGIDAPFAATLEHSVWRFRKQPKFVRLWGSNTRALQVFRYLLRRNRAARKVNFLAWKTVKR